MRLVGKDGTAAFTSRRHFFGAAAEAMRRIRVDNARRKKREKHGGDRERIELTLGAVIQPVADVTRACELTVGRDFTPSRSLPLPMPKTVNLNRPSSGRKKWWRCCRLASVRNTSRG